MKEKDFNYYYDFINKKISVNLYEQGFKLDSSLMNNNIENIETNLNILYEKTRYLQNMMHYIDLYVKKDMISLSNESRDILNKVEDLRDVNKDNGYMDYNVSLNLNKELVYDRDNEDLFNSKIQNDLIMNGDKYNKKVTYSHFRSESLREPFKRVFNKLNANNSMAAYIEEDILKDGITERVTIYFGTPQKINNMEIKLNNCEIKNITYTYPNNTEVHEVELQTGHFIQKTVIKLSFDLICNNSTKSHYMVSNLYDSNTYWNQIKEYEFNKLNNINTEMPDHILGEENDVLNDLIVSKTFYSYIFGIEELKFSYTEPYDNCYFISDYINIGNVSKTTYIEFLANTSQYDDCGIEFSILDGNNEMPICPRNNSMIYNEKILYNTNFRFNYYNDEDHDTIRKNGLLDNTKLLIAKQNARVDNYSIDYNANDCYTCNVINNNIRVKATLRRYNNKNGNIPYIKSMTIRKYGGNPLWIEEL